MPWKNSTLEIVPSVSEALAEIVMVDPVVKFALLAGLVMLAEGDTLEVAPDSKAPISGADPV